MDPHSIREAERRLRPPAADASDLAPEPPSPPPQRPRSGARLPARGADAAARAGGAPDLAGLAAAARAAAGALRCRVTAAGREAAFPGAPAPAVALCAASSGPDEAEEAEAPDGPSALSLDVDAALDRLCRDLLAPEPPTPRAHSADAAAAGWRLAPRRAADGSSLEGVALIGADGARLGAAAFAFPPQAATRPDLAALAPLLATSLAALLDGSAREEDLRASERRCRELARRADSDPLTGLANTRAFRAGARSRLETGGGAWALLLVDIDHLKRINDVFGHAFGDVYIQGIARTLGAALPDEALFGRIGGDEFAALVPLPRQGTAYLTSLLQRCRSSVLRAAALLGKPDLGRISVGVGLFPDHSDRFRQLFEAADAALYAAKDSGRGTTVVYQPRLHRRFNGRELERRFQAAIKRNRIVPYFHPLVDLRSGACAGFEVLARWIDEDGAVLAPSDFGAIFSDHRKAELVTRAMVSEGLERFAAWRAAWRGTEHAATVARSRLAVNLTALDLMNPEFAFDLQAELADRGFDWSAITLEVTENILLGDANGQIYRNLSELRARGARLAMDDFGTGYGGLQHLGRWPIDVLKIDRRFVRRMRDGVHDRAVIEAIIAIAARTGLDVVVEGVETREQLAGLRDMGARIGQGDFFARPLPPEALEGARAVYDVAPVPSAPPVAAPPEAPPEARP
ncbi:phosphodiesterase [Albimonas sp. CAU 1670]|uniref:phosphodiesterase n=1 Tax=Albimonas sp. CAU 1670 TaxID=3032599 RepID=UPI0023DBDF55|nr:phosphodiesterase [Albimonas sp. CAU 1670]MDF2235052.1 phosphodiesterase [Albimonas sp. CAU 1670]